MRFTSLASGLACLAYVALAQPAPGSPADGCCCCDINRNVIACTRAILKNDCVCAAVVCPDGAKTVWDDGKAAPTPTAKAGKTSNLLVRDQGATTILPVINNERMTILPVREKGEMTIVDPQPTQVTKAPGQPELNNNADTACCCCDPFFSKIRCSRTVKKSDCFCVAVVCPEGAKTVWDDGKPVDKTAASKPAPVSSELPTKFITTTKGV